MTLRVQSPPEEVANAVSHGVGLLVAVAASAALVLPAVRAGQTGRAVAFTVYGASLVLLYLCSTMYHALPAGRAKQVFQTLDHAMIFLLIAGSYTPFSLVVIRGTAGRTLFVASWLLGAAGIVLATTSRERFRRTRIALYAVAGWLIVFAAGPALRAMGPVAMAWLVGGGLAYTVGMVFYALRRVRYFHAVWHVFVIAGSALQFVALLVALSP